jgi:hypothetical protein
MKRFSIADFRFWIGVPALFILALVLALLAVPRAAEAQQPAKVYWIGYLAARTCAPPETTAQHCPIKGGLSRQAEALTGDFYS